MMSSPPQFDHNVRLDLAIEVLRTFGEIRFVAHGVSMLPSILPGDMMVVRKAHFSEIRAGDVVLYARNECFFAHRVISTDSQEKLITRGDALAFADSPIGERELLGRVVSIIRQLKTFPVTRHPGAWIVLQRWVLQRSDFATRGFLRAGRIYAQVKRILHRVRTSGNDKMLESS